MRLIWMYATVKYTGLLAKTAQANPQSSKFWRVFTARMVVLPQLMGRL
jgi:hypothetical protein